MTSDKRDQYYSQYCTQPCLSTSKLVQKEKKEGEKKGGEGPIQEEGGGVPLISNFGRYRRGAYSRGALIQGIAVPIFALGSPSYVLLFASQMSATNNVSLDLVVFWTVDIFQHHLLCFCYQYLRLRIFSCVTNKTVLTVSLHQQFSLAIRHEK